jgi:hypothetical protein
MPHVKRPPKNYDPRRWRVSLIRSRIEFLGHVLARTCEAAEAAAVEQFKLTDEQRKRLVLQEQP